MAEGHMRRRPGQYEDAEEPHNPPPSTGTAPAIVAGLWYVLAPVAMILLVLLVALLYWFRRDETPGEAVEPTTGTYDEATPGGGTPDSRYTTPEGEREHRGGQR